jgi:hypothetical protein
VQFAKMEDDLTIKKVGIVKLNGLNYRTWAVITRAVIKVKDTWDDIELLGLEAKASIKSTGDRTAEGKAAELSGAINPKADRVKDIKARAIIIGYCRPEPLSRILYLRTVRE